MHSKSITVPASHGARDLKRPQQVQTMDLVERLSIGKSVAEPLASQIDLGLNQVGSGIFDVRTEQYPGIQSHQSCRLYAGRSAQFTFLVFQGVVQRVDSPRNGVLRILAQQRCGVLELAHSIELVNCTAMQVLHEIVDASGVTFSTALPGDEHSAYLSTAIPKFTSHGTLRDALNGLGAAFGVADAVWYEQPDGRIFWGSWSHTLLAQNPLPLPSLDLLERDESGHRVTIPIVGSLRPGMIIQAPGLEFRIDKMQVQNDKMRLEWSSAQA